jgi:thiamine-monophosphate kinase
VRDLEALFAAEARRLPELEVGIGDDAAAFKCSGKKTLLWTSDACVEGVHFRRAWMSLEDVGWRSFQAAASDVAAMGGRALAALSNLILPAEFGQAELRELARGQALAARRSRSAIIGGNLARGSELSVTTSVLGECVKPVLRSGARPGHELWLFGEVGLARAGLELLRRGSRTRSKPLLRCLQAFRRPLALLDESALLAKSASAALDVSDGLAGDAARMADASGVRLVIEEAALRSALAPELELAASAVGVALYGGEDYALLAAGRAALRPKPARRIGRVERGHGTFLEHAGTRACTPLGDGFDHLSVVSGKLRASRRP